MTNIATAEKPALESYVGRMHSSSSGTADFQVPPHGLHPWTDAWAHPTPFWVQNCQGTAWARVSPEAGGWGALPGGGRAESGSLGLSQPQPGAGQPGLMGTAQAKAGTEHQSTDQIRIKILYLPVLNLMKFLLV